MRILIADNQSKVRFALRVVLEREPGFKMIDEVSDAYDLITQAKAICPDLAIVAWELAGMRMAELIRSLRQNCPTAKVIILGIRTDMRAPALAAGANEFACMCNTPDELMSAIDRCLKEIEQRPDTMQHQRK